VNCIAFFVPKIQKGLAYSWLEKLLDEDKRGENPSNLFQLRMQRTLYVAEIK
jgi:hypothetical protein